jgi:hypothetical protein
MKRDHIFVDNGYDPVESLSEDILVTAQNNNNVKGYYPN